MPDDPTPPEPVTPPPPPPEPAPSGGSDVAKALAEALAEAEKWKSQSRKHESRSKENETAAAELAKLREQSMSEQDKAVKAARDEGAAEERKRTGGKLVAYAITAAAAGRLDSAARDTLLENLDTSRFMTDAGEVDADKVSKLIDSLAPQPSDPPDKGNPRPRDLGQGRRQGAPEPSIESGRERGRREREERSAQSPASPFAGMTIVGGGQT